MSSQRPEAKARRQARERTPEFRAYHAATRKSRIGCEVAKAYNAGPNAAALNLKARARNRAISRQAAKDYGEFDKLLIVECYDLARRRTRQTGQKWVVDHRVPINGKEVCGLHVGVNLQVIPFSVNATKSNRLQGV